MPWLWLQTVTRPPSQRAIAQLGAIDACARNGRLNSALKRAGHGRGSGGIALVQHRLRLGRRRQQEVRRSSASGRGARAFRTPPARGAGHAAGRPHGGAVGAGHHAEERAVPDEHNIIAELDVGELAQLRPG